MLIFKVLVLFVLSISVKCSVLSRKSRGCPRQAQVVKISDESTHILKTNFIENCQQNYDIILNVADSDLRQWRLKVEIEEMNIDCSNGFLQVVEDGEQRQNIKLCKQRWSKSEHFIYSHEHFLSVRFRSQECANDGGCQNQSVKLKISAQYVCGGTYRKEGSITSPFWPQPYVNSMACLYDIMAPKGSKIILSCPEFNLSRAGREPTVFQSIDTFDTYTGNQLKGKKIKSKRNNAFFYFLSNNVRLNETGLKYGFNCTFTFQA